MSQKSDLPFASEFSLSQIELPALLKIVERHPGDPKALEREILQTYFTEHGGTASEGEQDNNRATLAYNCKLGMVAYGIIDKDANLTVTVLRCWQRAMTSRGSTTRSRDTSC